MKKGLIASVLFCSASFFLLLVAAAPARADDDNTVHWKTIIGIVQAGNVAAGVTGGGAPWSATGGEASVNRSTGQISFKVRGLVLAGGNSIGTPGAIAQVKGTLVCNAQAAAPATPVLVDTKLVALSATGDARITSDPMSLPMECLSPNTDLAFLVRIASGRWIANGAVRQIGDTD